MKCRVARDWLLRAENPGDLGQAYPGVVEHVRACPRCRRVLRDVRRLEELWRELPLPASMESAKAAFLEQHAPDTLPLPRRRWGGNLVRLAVAAALFLVVGLASWHLLRTPEVQTAEAVLDQLIDWNLQLSHTDDPEERVKLFQAKKAEFTQLAQKGDVPVEQKELVEKLLENADWLAKSDDDPLEEANRFGELADDMIDKLTAAKDEQTVSKLAESYSKLTKKGINDNLKQVAKEEKLKAKQKAELKKMLAQEERRLEKLEKAMQQSSAQAQKHLKQAVSVTGNHPHKKKKSNPPGK
jgi:hypothetical protein